MEGMGKYGYTAHYPAGKFHLFVSLDTGQKSRRF